MPVKPRARISSVSWQPVAGLRTRAGGRGVSRRAGTRPASGRWRDSAGSRPGSRRGRRRAVRRVRRRGSARALSRINKRVNEEHSGPELWKWLGGRSFRLRSMDHPWSIRRIDIPIFRPECPFRPDWYGPLAGCQARWAWLGSETQRLRPQPHPERTDPWYGHCCYLLVRSRFASGAARNCQDARAPANLRIDPDGLHPPGATSRETAHDIH